MSDPIRHALACAMPLPYLTRGRLGDPMTRCQTCGRFAILTEADAAQVMQAAPPAPAPKPAPRPVAGLLTVPGGRGGGARHGGAWPTHKAKARRQNAARLHRRAEGVSGVR